MFKFYNTLSFENSIDHKQTNWSVDDPYSFRQWYEEDIQERDTLLIQVGDSWTWGDHLGCIDWDKASNDPVRDEQIVGRQLSRMLESDFVNIARPGCSNYWMLEQLLDIEPMLHTSLSKYKQIDVVITLTEDLREAKYARRIQVLPQYTEFSNNSNSLEEFLTKVEGYLFNSLEVYFNRNPMINFHVSRAFTDVWPQNNRLFLMDKTWCDVIQDQIQFDRYIKPVPFIGQMAIGPLAEHFMPDSRKEEFLEIMQRVEYRWNFLGGSEYNLKGSTCHPNAAGHRLWAEYLYTQID